MAKERKRRPLPWNEQHCKALQLVFEGQLAQDKIAEDCHVPARTLRDWIAHPDFQEKLQEKRAVLERELTINGTLYVRKEQRIIALAAKAASASDEYDKHPWCQEIRPLPQKASLRIRRKNADGEMEANETEPLDVVVNETFNEPAFNAFRGALDDIAKELGHRKPDKGDGSDAAQIRIVIETDHGDVPSVQVIPDGERDTNE